ncbi:hypothetical protein KBD20_04590 [Candidatus Saccharibacteria bacterium]|nr:hypothetical protein [Candidatus Saccharibacteria bacterium]
MPTLAFEIQPSLTHPPETVNIGDDNSEISLELSDPAAIHDALEIYNTPVVYAEGSPQNTEAADQLLVGSYEDKKPELEAAGQQLADQVVTGNRVVLSGLPAQLALEKAAIFAEEPTSELQIISIKLLEKYRRTEADTEELDPFANVSERAQRIIKLNRTKNNIDPLEAQGVSPEPGEEYEMFRRAATRQHIGKVVKNEVALYTDTKPEPIWVDQSGNKLAKDEYFRAYNFSETGVTMRALNRYLTVHNRKDEFSKFDQPSSDTQGLIELKGQEALDARAALRMVAEESIEEALETTKEKDKGRFKGSKMLVENLEADRKHAARMLAIREQGPKNVETVQINPEDEVIRTGEVIGAETPQDPVNEVANQRHKRSTKTRTSRIHRPLAA